MSKIFEKIENPIRYYLSHHPFLYGIIVSIGVVLIWRGIWHTADALVTIYVQSESLINLSDILWWDGPLSFIIGFVILLFSGVFVSSFIGNEILISGLRKEKVLAEKTEDEIEQEFASLKEIKQILNRLERQVDISSERNKNNG